MIQTVADAKAALRTPLKFGDPEQIYAVRLIERAEELRGLLIEAGRAEFAAGSFLGYEIISAGPEAGERGVTIDLTRYNTTMIQEAIRENKNHAATEAHI